MVGAFREHPSMSSESTSAGRSILPQDIWVEIAEQLGAFDVFSLSRVCRELYFFLSRKGLWIRILRSVCRRHGVFLPTYPLSETEMTLPQIQSAASRPGRWHNLICRRASPLGPCDSFASMRQSIKGHPVITPTIEGKSWSLCHWRVHLVPGGRFLVTLALHNFGTNYSKEYMAEHTTVVLSVWDLGVPGSADHRVPSILASQPLYIASPTGGFADVSRTGVVVVGDSLLRVVIVHPNGPRRDWSWTVLAFDANFSAPDGNAPSLKRRQASITINAPDSLVSDMYLRGDRVLLRFPESIVIWDVKTVKYVSLMSYAQLAVLTNDHLVSIGATRLGVWHLSALDWREGGPSPRVNEAPSQPVSPDIAVSVPWNDKAWNRITFTHVPIPAVTENRVYFDVHYQPDAEYKTVRYHLDVAPHPSGSLDKLPRAGQGARASLTLVSAARLPRYITNVDLAHGQVCYLWAGSRFAWSYAYILSDCSGMTFTALSKYEEEGALTKCVRLGDGSPHAFCALSGRMVCLRPIGDGMQYNVKVVDYLP